MLTLYYSPRACSMASHVALEEVGATFRTRKIDIFGGEQFDPAYRAINPRERVPALRFDDGTVLVETIAILHWAAAAFPDAGLLGRGPQDQAQTISVCAWLSGSVHPSFAQVVRPERYSDEDAAFEAIRAQGKARFWNYLREIDARLARSDWMMGSVFTAADAYAAVFLPWGREIGLPIAELEHFFAMKDRLIVRPATRRALEREQSRLLRLER